MRRSYPRLSVVDQGHLAQLLLASPEVQAYVIAQPSQFASDHLSSSSKETAITPADGQVDLTKAIATVAEAGVAKFSPSSLPPKPPSTFKWQPKQSPDAPHDPKAYFPMALYS